MYFVIACSFFNLIDELKFVNSFTNNYPRIGGKGCLIYWLHTVTIAGTLNHMHSVKNDLQSNILLMKLVKDINFLTMMR